MTATAKTVYIPRMADHALGVAAAMRNHGIRAEVLPPPDAETMAIGLDLCRGRECLPCFLCTGDMIRRSRQPGFDPEQAIFFMPTGPGPCRFGQYRALERDILDALGLSAIEVLSPSSAASYALFGSDPSGLRKLVWQAIVGVDLLLKLVHEHRPYERVAGAADEVFTRSLGELVEALEAGGGRRAVRALERAADEFSSLPVDRSQPRPVIGIVGELYVMLNLYSNGGLVREVEAAGGEVLQSTFMDWLGFSGWMRKTQDLLYGDYRDWLDALLTGTYQDRVERRLHHAVAHALRHPPEAPMAETMRLLAPHYEPALGTEAVLTMARAMDYAAKGLCGILNVLPFACMPGIVVAAMAPRLRESLGGCPWLDLSYDGQEQTNTRTRLEAFMHQAFQYRKRRYPARPCSRSSASSSSDQSPRSGSGP